MRSDFTAAKARLLPVDVVPVVAPDQQVARPHPTSRTLRRTWPDGLVRELHTLKQASNARFMLAHAGAKLLPMYSLCGVRSRLYRLAGCDIAEEVAIQGALALLGSGPATHRLHIGAGSIVAPLVVFGLDADISIGRRVAIGPGAALHTATHDIGFGSRRMQLKTTAHSITIHDGAWVGAHCVVLPGVSIGAGAVVAAGAVVTESVPANVFVAGNPAVVRDTLPFGNR